MAKGISLFVGEGFPLPPNDPTVFSLTLEATSLAKQRRLFKKSEVYGKTKSFKTVGTDVLGCVKYLLFSGEEKRSKKVAGDYYRDCVPDPATLFGVSELINACPYN